MTQELECSECGKSELMFCVVDEPDPIASNFQPDGDDYSEESKP